VTLLTDYQFRSVAGVQATGTDDVTTNQVDVTNFAGVTFVAYVTAATAGTGIKIQQRDTGGTWADLAASFVQATGNLVLVTVNEPAKEKLRAIVSRPTLDQSVGPVLAVLHAKSKPANNVDNASLLIAGTILTRPDEGDSGA